MRKMVVLATNSGREFAELVCDRLSVDLGKARVGRFNDGEVDVQIEENVRDADVFIIGSVHPPAENLLEMRLLAEAARGSSASRITMIPTYLGYNRQDRKDRPRVPISARTAINILEESSTDRFLLVDLHSPATMSAFNVRTQVDHLVAVAPALPYLKDLVSRGSYVVGSTDAGGLERARMTANLLGLDIAIFLKERVRPGVLAEKGIRVVGDVYGRRVLFVDDIVDTSTTVTLEAKAAFQRGATGADVFATHGLFSKDAMSKIAESGIREVIVTDTISQTQRFQPFPDKFRITVISIAPLVARAITRLYQGQSLTELIPKPPPFVEMAQVPEAGLIRAEIRRLKEQLKVIEGGKGQEPGQTPSKKARTSTKAA